MMCIQGVNACSVFVLVHIEAFDPRTSLAGDTELVNTQEISGVWGRPQAVCLFLCILKHSILEHRWLVTVSW